MQGSVATVRRHRWHARPTGQACPCLRLTRSSAGGGTGHSARRARVTAISLQRTSNLPATTNRPLPCGVAITISEVSGEIPVNARIVDPCDSITVLPLPGFRETIGLSLAICKADWSDRPNRLPRAGSIAGSRPSASLDVSMQRHQGLDSTSPIGTPRSRSTSPSLRACSRPSSLRLR